MSEAVVLRDVGPTTVVTVGGVQMVMPQLVIDAGAAAIERFLEFFAAQLRQRPNPRGLRARGRTVSDVVSGARAQSARAGAPPRRGVYPHPSGIGPDRQAAPRGDPRPLRLARRVADPAGQSRRRRPRPEARRHDRQHARPDGGGDPGAPGPHRPHVNRRPARFAP